MQQNERSDKEAFDINIAAVNEHVVNNEKIYTDFSFLLEMCENATLPQQFDLGNNDSNAALSPEFRQSLSKWGNYDSKPEVQEQWEKQLAQVSEMIADYHPHLPVPDDIVWAAEVAGWRDGFQGKDIRPRLKNGITGEWMLLDTGAQITVVPKSMYPKAKLDKYMSIQAVNKTKINTYGTVMIPIRIGRKTFNHEAIIADVSESVIGFDFCKKYRLSTIWTETGDLELWDRQANIHAPLRMCALTHGQWPNLDGFTIKHECTQACSCKLVHAMISEMPSPGEESSGVIPSGPGATGVIPFKQWSQTHTTAASKQTKPQDPPPQYKKLLQKHKGILSCDFKAKAVKHGIVHKLATGNNPPCRAKVRPLMPGSPKAIEGERAWRELETLGVIVPVDPRETNDWTSALHLAPKPDGTLRVCGDFRALNDATAMDGFPLPDIRNFVGNIKGSTIFSKVDLKKAYHQVPLCPESQRKTTVVTPWGAWKFTRLAMGLRNSAQSFQKLMMHLLGDVAGVFVYMDDILVYSKDEQAHLKTLDTMFKILEDAGLAINPDKCVFGLKKVEFLGYEVNEQGIAPLPRKLQAIAGYPTPPTQKSLLGYLGALNYYRRCLQPIRIEEGQKKVAAAEILQPLYEAATTKLPPKVTWAETWAANAKVLDAAFIRSKQMLMEATMLNHPDPSAPLSLTTDASKKAIGGVLEQFVNGMWQPLGFWSRHLKQSQQAWTTFRRELYAVQQGLRHFLTEVQGRHCVIFTDHKPLLGAFKAPNLQPFDPIASNQIQEISMFTNDIRYLSGKANCVADWLSRPDEVPLGEAYQVPTDPEIATISAENEAAVLQQLSLELIDHRAMSDAQADCPRINKYRLGHHPKSIVVKDIEFSPGVTLLCEVSDGCRARPIVPVQWQDIIIRMFHQLAHPGQKETCEKVSQRYYWDNMRADVAEYVGNCPDCLAVKPFKRIRPVMGSIPVPDKRFSSIQVDIVGPLPVSQGKRYLLTIFDRTSRWFEALPLVEANAKECCDAFLHGWVKNFGLPQVATSDNGNTFISNLWKDLHASLGIEVAFTPPYHSESLGGVERKHRDLKLALKASLHQALNSDLEQLAKDVGEKWMARLPWVLLGRRTAYQPELDATSAELVYGSNPVVPGDIVGHPGAPLTEAQLQLLLEGVKANANQPAIPMSKHRQPPVNMPDLSKVTHVRVERAKPGPLGHAWAGPFKIVERVGQACIRLKVGNFADGRPKYELQHWVNCKPCPPGPNIKEAQRPLPGRKPLNPEAKEFRPAAPTGANKPTQPTGVSAKENHSAPVDTAPQSVQKPAAQNNDICRNGGGPVHAERRTRTRVIRAPKRYGDYVAAVKGITAA